MKESVYREVQKEFLEKGFYSAYVLAKKSLDRVEAYKLASYFSGEENYRKPPHVEKDEDNNPVIEKPSYYRLPCGIMASDVIDPFRFCTASAMKYIIRNGKKLYDGKSARESAIIDLKKAISSLSREVKRLEKQGDDEFK